ncbi:MAG: twin-arginine translocation signal domain-containing protein [Candidatus Latescibacteria bacterium]|nr:twin-arginine translocation signal domain-containing protein [Candidatus Latescibacterota bacterium]
MNSSRRDFIKDAAIVGTAVATGTGVEIENAEAEMVYDDVSVDESTRCPYFDQPLFCKGMTSDGKLLCEQ